MPPVRFDQLRSRDHISLVWGVATEDLDAIVRTVDQQSHYRLMQVPKRGAKNRGRFRTIHKPEWGVLHQLQKNIARDIGDTVSFPDCVQGFVRGRSTRTNAELHVGRRVIVHADIADFFDQIRLDQVSRAFVGLGCDPAIAAVLARVCTLNGRLPQGASTSPVVANLVCTTLDAELTRLATLQRVRYSRYADDLTFSGDAPPDLDAIRRVVEGQGFALREDKVRSQWRGKSQFVTGLSVGDASGPRVPAREKRRLRQELYYARRYGIANHQARAQVGQDWHEERLLQYWRGWIDYVSSIPAEGAVAGRLRSQLDAIRQRR
ncbi:MAG: reverse transcriptase family protein [Vicinamibacterales bacterium]